MPYVRFGFPQEMLSKTLKLQLRSTTKAKQEPWRAASIGEEIRFYVSLASTIPLWFVWKDKKRQRNHHYSNGFTSNQRSIDMILLWFCMCVNMPFVM